MLLQKFRQLRIVAAYEFLVRQELWVACHETGKFRADLDRLKQLVSNRGNILRWRRRGCIGFHGLFLRECSSR